jgi:predicted ATP-binding protein involved in virulence
VVVIDDVELHQEPAVQRGIVPALREALPRVQWVVATASSLVASGCEANEVVALRRMPASVHVEVFEGDQATTH